MSWLDAEHPPPLGVLELVVDHRPSDRHRVFALHVLSRKANEVANATTTVSLDSCTKVLKNTKQNKNNGGYTYENLDSTHTSYELNIREQSEITGAYARLDSPHRR